MFVRSYHHGDTEDTEVLVADKQQLDNVILIYNGVVSVESGGQEIAQLRDGSLVGEMSFVNDGVANATVRGIRPTRYLTWLRVELRHLLSAIRI